MKELKWNVYKWFTRLAFSCLFLGREVEKKKKVVNNDQVEFKSRMIDTNNNENNNKN